MIQLHPALLILAMVQMGLVGCGLTWAWGSRDRRLARQFIRAKRVTAAVDLRDRVPYEIWEAVAPHEVD